MKVALWGNTSKPLFWELLPKVAAWMEEKGQEGRGGGGGESR